MTTDLEDRLTRAFVERAAVTPISPRPVFRAPMVEHGRRATRWVTVVAAGIAVAGLAVFVGVAMLAPGSERLVSSSGFDGEPIAVVGAVPLGLDGVVGWQRASFSDRVDNRLSFCQTVASDGTCTSFVGSTVAEYERDDGARVEIHNEFGPIGSASVMWQGIMGQVADPPETTVRGHPAGRQQTDGAGQPSLVGWSDTDRLHMWVSSTDLSGGDLVALADQLVASPSPISVRTVEVGSIDTDDDDPSSFGPGLLSLVAGKVDGDTCVALLGFNGNERCEGGFDYGNGLKSAIAGRVPGGNASVVAAMLPAETASVVVDIFDRPSVTLAPLTAAGFDERFVLETFGTSFPTAVHAFDDRNVELGSWPVDPLFGEGFTRGLLDGRAWDLSFVGDSCLGLSDVSSGAQDCNVDPSPTGITTGSALLTLQFGRTGAEIVAVEVGGIRYPTIEVPDRSYRAWVAPLGGIPGPIGADGQRHEVTATTIAPPSFCAQADQLVDGTDPGWAENVGLRNDPTLTEQQRFLFGVGLNHALAADAAHPSPLLVETVDLICHPDRLDDADPA